jgi:cytochrome c oxidase subunit 1
MLARVGAGVASAGTLLHIGASLRAGMRGMPRRYYDYDPDFRAGHMLAGIATAVALFGIALLAVAWLVGRSLSRR